MEQEYIVPFVEFCNNVGFEGGGKEYKPLKKVA